MTLMDRDLSDEAEALGEQPAYILDPEEIAAKLAKLEPLREFTTSEHWTTLVGVLNGMESREYELLLRAKTHEGLVGAQARANLLREISEIPQQTQTAIEVLSDQLEQATAPAEEEQ